MKNCHDEGSQFSNFLLLVDVCFAVVVCFAIM